MNVTVFWMQNAKTKNITIPGPQGGKGESVRKQALYNTLHVIKKCTNEGTLYVLYDAPKKVCVLFIVMSLVYYCDFNIRE